MPIIVDRKTGEVLSAPKLTAAQKEELWEIVVRTSIAMHPEILLNLNKADEKSKPPLKWWFAQPLEGAITGFTPKGALKVWHRITLTGRR